MFYFRRNPKFKGGAVILKDTMHFGKYLILFMIIYVMVKLGLVLSFLRMEKVFKCCVNIAL